MHESCSGSFGCHFHFFFCLYIFSADTPEYVQLICLCFEEKVRQRNRALLCSRGGNIVLVGSSAAYSPAGVCCLS